MVRLELYALFKSHIQNLELSAISSTRSKIFNYEATTANSSGVGHKVGSIFTNHESRLHAWKLAQWNHRFSGTIGLLTAACLALYSRQVVATSGNTVSSMWSHKRQPLLFQRWYQLAFLPSGDQDLQNLYNLVESTALTYLIPQQTVYQFETSCA